MRRKPQGANSSLIWIALAVVVAYFAYSQFVGQDRTRLTYSKFKELVKQGDVAEVTIRGNEIGGSFENSYESVTAAGDTATYEAFNTVNPGYENEQLINLLEDNDVTVNAETTEGMWWIWIAILIVPWLLILGWGMYVRNKISKSMSGRGDGGGGLGGGGMGGPGGGLFGMRKSRAKRYQKKAETGVTFNDVAGLENEKKDLREIVDYLKSPDKFISLGAEIPKGVLLMGAPGTGKTLLARAVAGEADVPFFSISGSEFIEMLVGVGASRVRNMFADAKKEKPAIIFIDELDSIGRSRGAGLGGGHDEREQTLNQILSEMDGFEPQESVIVMAATNRPDILDPALTRPGRFDRRVVINPPERPIRKKILEIHTRKMPLQNIDLETIAGRTVGFTGADLKNLVNEAALLAGRRDKKTIGPEELDEAIDKVMLGRRQESKLNDEEKNVVAYHEAGHAMVAKLLPNTDPLQKVTIIPRGRSLGATQQIPELDRHNYNRDYLLARIAVMLGGRASERLVLQSYTNGAANDLHEATKLARKMVCRWGMSERLGPVTFSQGQDQVFLGREIAQNKDYSEKTGEVIDDEIQRILTEMEKKATEVLSENRESLDKVVSELLDHETLEDKEVDVILKQNGHGNGKEEK